MGEAILSHLAADIENHLNRVQLSHEEYSRLLQNLGSRESFVDFRTHASSDPETQSVCSKISSMWSNTGDTESLVYLLRLKRLLLEMHINQARAYWYPDVSKPLMAREVVKLLRKKLNEMVEDGEISCNDASRYLRKVQASTRQSS